MSLIFENSTPFSALHFEQLDQFDECFHVFVARVRYVLGPRQSNGRASLELAAEQPPLVDEDEYVGEVLRSDVRCESDLAPYKPLCDVLVHGRAHSPQGTPVKSVLVRLTVRRPASPVPLPPQPSGLNPLMPPSEEQMAAWRSAVSQATDSKPQGELLLDKALRVTGERWFVRRWWPSRAVRALVAVVSLGSLRPSPWRLTSALPFSTQPVGFGNAMGGEVRILQANPAARRLGGAEQGGAGVPVLHEAHDGNPVGKGFATHEYLKATGTKRFAAPALEHSDKPLTAQAVWAAVRGKRPWPTPTSLGVVGRAWRPRRDLLGKIQEKAEWAEDEYPRLPPEFDHRYWNCAPDDQQCVHMHGGEVFELRNLCSAQHPSATEDGRDTVLRFALPEQPLWLAMGDNRGRIAAKRMVIDTVLIEPDDSRVEVVWRGVVPAATQLSNAQLRSGLTSHAREQLARVLALQQASAANQLEAARGA